MTATVLILKTVHADMTANHGGGFVWPTSGPVEAPDWDPTPECGGGLHGALWGEGDGGLFNWDPDAVWLVFEADADDVVDLSGKVKAPRGTVVQVGDRVTVTSWLHEQRPGAIIGGTATAGYRGTATAGSRGTATAGNGGTATAGYRGTATAGDLGTATAGHNGTATAGYRGTATAGHWGTATAGHGGTATAGYRGTATAGDEGTATAGHGGTATAGDLGTATAGHEGTATAGYRGTATAGYEGTATAGYRGTATAGYRGTATAGDGGVVQVGWFDGRRRRITTGYVGEDGIEADTPYRCDDTGKLVKA